MRYKYIYNTLSGLLNSKGTDLLLQGDCIMVRKMVQTHKTIFVANRCLFTIPIEHCTVKT